MLCQNTLDPLISSFSDFRESLHRLPARGRNSVVNSICFAGLMSTSVHASHRLEIAQGTAELPYNKCYSQPAILLCVVSTCLLFPSARSQKKSPCPTKGQPPLLKLNMNGKQDHCPSTPTSAQRQNPSSISHTRPITSSPIFPASCANHKTHRQHQDNTTLANTGRTPC